MVRSRVPFGRTVAQLLCLQAALSLLLPQPTGALEEVIVSYAGPSVTFLPAELARQRGFLREQNLGIKLLLTRSEVDRAALISGSVDYTLRAGSSFVSAARGTCARSPVDVFLAYLSCCRYNPRSHRSHQW
jgi:hypothetical protein